MIHVAPYAVYFMYQALSVRLSVIKYICVLQLHMIHNVIDQYIFLNILYADFFLLKKNA